MMREKTRLPTKTESIYQHLRADVLAGRLEPGRRLRYAELCGRYQTSMAVLREAMLRLAEQGLVRAEPQLGFQVVSLSPADLRELTDARIEMETLVLGRAIAEGDVSWEARAIAAHHQLARAPKLAKDNPQRLSDEWAHAHSAFHAALLDGCANRRLKAMANGLRDSAELTRRWSIPLDQGQGRDTAAEHAAILDATISRDAPLAVAHLTAHIQRTTDILLAAAGEDCGTVAELRQAAPLQEVPHAHARTLTARLRAKVRPQGGARRWCRRNPHPCVVRQRRRNRQAVRDRRPSRPPA